MTTRDTCLHCQADRRMWPLIAAPTATVPISGVCYAITGDWIIGPLGAGVGFAVAAILVAWARRRWS